jgi:hypothetical protein
VLDREAGPFVWLTDQGARRAPIPRLIRVAVTRRPARGASTGFGKGGGASPDTHQLADRITRMAGVLKYLSYANWLIPFPIAIVIFVPAPFSTPTAMSSTCHRRRL